MELSKNQIILADNMDVLPRIPDESVPLVYIDPPFNTGSQRKLSRIQTTRDNDGDRIGFKGQRYRTTTLGEVGTYSDAYDDYLAFFEPRLRELYRVLTVTGSLFLHLDPRESHYCKVLLDQIFGRESFVNEIIWAYDFGGRSKRRWPAKHDTILWYAKDPKNYTFNYEAIDRIPYLAPGLVGEEKAKRGKTPTDVWWQTIVPTSGLERTGYPTQKPLAIVERIVRVHSNPQDVVMDCFAGSGTTGDAAARNGRRYLLVDNNHDAVEVTARRLAASSPVCVGFEPPHVDVQSGLNLESP